MKCPMCDDHTLEPTDENGIRIDVCPGCRGVWLDRGELDKLNVAPIQPAARVSESANRTAEDNRRNRDRYGERDQDRTRKRTNKAKRLADMLEGIVD